MWLTLEALVFRAESPGSFVSVLITGLPGIDAAMTFGYTITSVKGAGFR